MTALLLLVVSTVGVRAADIEYGSIADLRGVTEVFIDSGDDTKFRDDAIATLRKELPDLRVVAKRGDAKIQMLVNIEPIENGSMARVRVVMDGSAPDAVRLIATYSDTKTSRLTPALSTVLMRRFARDYRTANAP